MKIWLFINILLIGSSEIYAQAPNCKKWEKHLYDHLNKIREDNPEYLYSLAFIETIDTTDYKKIAMLKVNEKLNDQLSFIVYASTNYASSEIISNNSQQVVEKFSNYIISHSMNFINSGKMSLVYEFIGPKRCRDSFKYAVIARINKLEFYQSPEYQVFINKKVLSEETIKRSNKLLLEYEKIIDNK